MIEYATIQRHNEKKIIMIIFFVKAMDQNGEGPERIRMVKAPKWVTIRRESAAGLVISKQ